MNMHGHGMMVGALLGASMIAMSIWNTASALDATKHEILSIGAAQAVNVQALDRVAAGVGALLGDAR